MQSLTKEDLLLIKEEEIEQRAKDLNKDDLSSLVEWLSSKDDKIRYQCFILLRTRSRLNSDVFSYWDIFRDKLKSDNSYQRSLGVMLIAKNAKWDQEGKMKDTLQEYLDVLHDEKIITVRQCIQSLKLVVQQTSELHEEIGNCLIQYNIMSVRESMRKLILVDIIDTLIEIKKTSKNDQINTYILNALSGEILDKKSKKIIEALL
jgi:hypothetical protein